MGYTVLIVEDDQQQRELLHLALERAGYTVAEAVNGAEALQYLMSYTPDVIVLDILMPMLGGELFSNVFNRCPRCKMYAPWSSQAIRASEKRPSVCTLTNFWSNLSRPQSCSKPLSLRCTALRTIIPW